MKFLPYIALLIFLVIILLQNKGCEGTVGKIDTVTVTEYIHVIDTFYQKSNPIVIIQKDTIWLTSKENAPDTTYNGLLGQYIGLGNRHFEKKLYSTPFSLGKYGSLTVHDSISQNKLTKSWITTNLIIPETTHTIEKTVPYRQLYWGVSIIGNPRYLVSGVFGDLQLKTKKDKIYGISIGYTGEISYKGSLLFPLKLK